jgi:hypothetical protein
MVNLIGVVNESYETLGGNVESNNCQQFSLKKIDPQPMETINGIWKGLYLCLQGKTELTLTIKSK